MSDEFVKFDLEITRSLKPSQMWLPDREHYSMFRMDNHEFGRIRCSKRRAKEALAYERELLNRLERAHDLDEELEAIHNEIYEDDCPPLMGLDIGVAAAVLSLTAVGCVTVSSCNGGCFGDYHKEHHPLVAFYANPDSAAVLLSAAEKSGVGIGHDRPGLLVWSNDIWHMHNFAVAVLGLPLPKR